MAEKLDAQELVQFKELLIANTIQVDALAQLLIEEGLISEQKFLAKLKTVQADYRKRQSYDLKNLYPEVKQALIELSLMLTFNLEDILKKYFTQ